MRWSTKRGQPTTRRTNERPLSHAGPLHARRNVRPVEAARIYGDWQPANDVEFVMGNTTAAAEIRRRWPRLCGPCPLGCGYNGIYYASWEHYGYGDW